MREGSRLGRRRLGRLDPDPLPVQGVGSEFATLGKYVPVCEGRG